MVRQDEPLSCRNNRDDVMTFVIIRGTFKRYRIVGRSCIRQIYIACDSKPLKDHIDILFFVQFVHQKGNIKIITIIIFIKVTSKSYFY